MPDHRNAERTKSFVGGQIVFNDRHSTLFCIVRNLSKAGAKIEVGGALQVPAAFDLRLNGKDTEFKARVVWRNEHSLGVKFLSGQGL